MNLFFAAINIGFLLFVAGRIWKTDQGMTRKFFWPAFLVKLAGGIGLGLVYSFYYKVGDTLVYFQDATILTSLARTDPWLYLKFLWYGDESFPVWADISLVQSRALFMVKITSIVNLLSHDNYWITSLYFSFASFAGAWVLVKRIVRFDPTVVHAAVFSFLFFPSVVFWSSGLIKESLAMASLCYLSMIYLKFLMRERPSLLQGILIILSLWITWNLKYYYLAVFLPVAASSLTVSHIFSGRLKSQRPAVKALTGLMIFLIPLILVSVVHPNFYPERFLDVIVSNNEEFHAISDPDDLIYYHSLEPSFTSVLFNTPWALVSGLFRPFPWEAGTVFQGIISLENTLLFLLAATATVNVRKMIRSPGRIMLFSVVLYSVLLCVFLALSTPNFGTLSRYRVGFLPFFLLLISIENPLIGWFAKIVQRSS